MPPIMNSHTRGYRVLLEMACSEISSARSVLEFKVMQRGGNLIGLKLLFQVLIQLSKHHKVYTKLPVEGVAFSRLWQMPPDKLVSHLLCLAIQTHL